MRFILLLASLATLLAPCAARATDYYVRTDGLDGNPGTSNSATGAFLTVRRCAQVAQAGDRCLVQSGTYLETPTNQANAGSLVGSALATCTCTRKSTSVTCMGAVPASITAGMFVRCSGAHGFAWSRVKSVNGASLSLSEPYRGASLTDAPLDAARFVEILGQGARPRDVVISEFRAKPPQVVWEKEATHACLWRYVKGSAVDPTWKMANAFREEVPDTQWNLFLEQKNGRDLYYRVWATGGAPAGSGGDCPCQAGAIAEQVQSLPGSWGDDGTFIWLQTRGCVDPDTAHIVAGKHGSGGEAGYTFQSQQPYTIIDNLAVDTAGFDYAGKSSLAFGFVLGASNARYSNLVEEGGRLELIPPPGSVDTLYEHLRALEGSQCALSTGHSGLTIYDVEIRGGAPVGLSCGAISGAASGDPIVFERVYAHRSFPALGGVAACGGGTTWDCASHSFKPCASCENQDVRLWASPAVKMGDETNDNATDHIVVRNSVLELASDGWGIFHGSGGKDVWFVNNTFGNAHRTDDGLKAILGSAGANGNWGAKLYNNLFVLGGATQGGIRYLGIRGEIASDYNLFMPFGASGSTRIWNAGETLESVITTEGQETHSALVCASGCAGAQGTYFNDSGESGLIDPSLLDGTPADYTPKATFRGIDIGANTFCPEEDFVGLPRDDGHCDIGAIEWRAVPPGPDAGAPEPDSSVLLEDGAVVATGDAATDYGDGGLESGDAAGQAGDGGLVIADASTAVSGDGAVRGDAGGAAVPKGCGCGSAGGVMMPLVALLGFGLCRRTRRRG